jgi:hypothetical protein
MRLIPFHRAAAAPKSPGPRPSAPRRFTLSCQRAGWLLSADGTGTTQLQFADLAAALAHARDIAGGKPSDIELWADGLYVFIHQTEGWPHRITRAAPPPRRSHRRY